jgi:hypothetical protein
MCFVIAPICFLAGYAVGKVQISAISVQPQSPTQTTHDIPPPSSILGTDPVPNLAPLKQSQAPIVTQQAPSIKKAEESEKQVTPVPGEASKPKKETTHDSEVKTKPSETQGAQIKTPENVEPVKQKVIVESDVVSPSITDVNIESAPSKETPNVPAPKTAHPSQAVASTTTVGQPSVDKSKSTQATIVQVKQLLDEIYHSGGDDDISEHRDDYEAPVGQLTHQPTIASLINETKKLTSVDPFTE